MFLSLSLPSFVAVPRAESTATGDGSLWSATGWVGDTSWLLKPLLTEDRFRMWFGRELE
jgi:hypothetical protein